MADLRDSIRLTTVADLQALSELVNEYKKLGLSISGVAGASRVMSEQIKRDALEKANATKQSTLATQLDTAELKKQAAALDLSKKSSDGLFSSLSGITGLRSQLIGLFGAMSIGAFAKDIIDAQSQVEAFGLSMNNLLGQKYGEKLVSDLKKFTVETPLNFEDVIKSSNQLVGSFKAAGASSREIGDEIPKILESLGNSAAALGGDGRLGRLTYAFSQVQATGRLMGTEVHQITETGFPLLAVMSQTTGKSVQELQKDITAGKISFEQFKTAILSAGKEGGVFAGAMDIMANTVRGRLDKLSETFFFAKARIGDALTSSAKSAIDFANSLIKAFFGTDEAIKNTIEYVKQLVFLGATLKLIAGYEAALATGKRILNALELAGNVIRTQMAVITATAAGNTTLLAAAELEAAAATRVFSAAVSSSTLGAFLFVIGAAIGAYELYKSNLEEVNELTFDNIKATDSDVKALMTKQSQLNATANSALGLSEETAGYRLQVGKLIKQYPEYFGNLDAEKASHDDIRKALFFANNEMERKIKLMVQEKLAEKLADRSADLKIQIAQEEIAAQTILDKRVEYQKKQLELKKKGLSDEYTEQLGAYEFDKKSLEESNKRLAELKGKDAINQKLQQKATNSLLASEQEDYQIRHNAIIKKWNDKGFETRKQFTDAIIALDEEYGYGQRKRAESLGKAGKEAGEKALKYQKDTAKEKEVFEELVYVKGLEKTRQHETAILDIEQFYNLSKIKNSVGSQKKKNEETIKITKKYLEDAAELNRKWDKEEEKENLENRKKELDDNYKMQVKLINQAREKMEEQQKINKKEYDEKIKLDENYVKESKKLSEKQYELRNDLRILDRVSNAKTSKELIALENEEKQKILESAVKSYEQKILLAKLHVARMKVTYGEDSVQYKQATNDMLIVQQEFTDASIDLAKFRTEKVKDSIEKEAEAFKQILSVVTDITSQMFDAVDKQTDERLSKSTSAIEKNLLNNIKKETQMAKDGLSAIVSLASGDVAGAVSKGISLLFTAIDNAMNRSANHAKAVMQEQQEMITRYASKAQSDIENILTQINGLSDIYKPIQTVTLSLEEQSKLLDEYIGKLGERGFSSIDLINSEISYGKEVQKNYENRIDGENTAFEKKMDNIDRIYDTEIKRIKDAYDLQIESINRRYDYETLRANQNYNSQTIGIVAAGTAQLEALITNETVLSEVRAEFAAKRLQIEEAFPLASKQITADMSQAEVDAINASIEARDDAFAQLQERYNTELVTIAEAEGQKRKEYTATEKIQNEIRQRLELASLTFEADEIKREQKKQQEIIDAAREREIAELAALDNRNSLIASATKILNETLIFLEKQKNDALLESFKRLQQGIEAEANRVSGLLSAINDKTSQEYKDLQEQLGLLINKYKELVGINPTIIITDNTNTPSRQPRGFEKGTDNTSVSLSGATVDNRGGKLAVLHPDEAVFSKADMTQMTRFLGKRPTRDEVIERFKMGTKLIDSNSFIQKISPYVINKTEVKNNTDVRELTKKIERLTKEVVKRQQPMVTVDKNGIRTFVTNINSQIEIKNQKFSS